MYLETKLVEQIGIDRSRIRDFEVLSVDISKVAKHMNVTLEKHGDVRYTLKDGSKFVKLKICDNVWFGTFIAGIKKYGQKYILETSMDITVNDKEIANLNNLSVEQYKQRLDFIRKYLHEEYGVDIDIRNVRISMLEINTTFEIDNIFYQYHRPLRLMMYNLPNSFKVFSEYVRADKHKQRIESETFYRQNSCLQAKIYDKRKQLKDTKGIDIQKNVMRIEFVLRNSAKVKDAFGTNLLCEITDVMLIDYYMKLFHDLFEKKYFQWRKENGKKIKQLILSHKEKNAIHWQRNLLSECRNYEQINRVPIILEIEDLLEQVKLIVKNRHYARTKDSILSKCEINDVYLQKDSMKIEEIICKVNKIYDEYINREFDV